MTLYISWSSLRVHETCKERGFHQRSGRKPSIDNVRVFFPGTVTDRVVRDWLENDPSPGLMPDMVEDVVDREWKTIQDEGGTIAWKNPGDRAQVIADCREAVTKIEPVLQRLVLPYEYQADFGFKAPLLIPHPGGGYEHIVLRGYMDIIVRSAVDKWWVWDVKHTRDSSYWRKTKGQTIFYDLACEILFGVGTQAVGLLQPLADPEVKAFKVTTAERMQMLQRIIGMARDVWNEEHPPRKDSSECHFCNVKHACSKFQPVVLADGKRRVSF